MKAIVIDKPGPPEVLKIREVPDPVAKDGWVTIRIRAFGLNRAELFTRQGDSPSVIFPRIIGIECVGEVLDDPSGTIAKGTAVATLMGEMGRAYDGSYAEQTVVPLKQVNPIKTNLAWPSLAAIPEMFQTANGSLRYALRVQGGRSILIRGGTSSVGLAAASLARRLGLFVISTSRSADRETILREYGANEVLIDDETPLSGKLLRQRPEGVHYVLDLIGTKTLTDSLLMLTDGGVACMTGILGGEWDLNHWNPIERIPNGRYLTGYGGSHITREDLQSIVDDVESGKLPMSVDRVFAFDEIVEAHRYMETNQATGKVVVVVD